MMVKKRGRDIVRRVNLQTPKRGSQFGMRLIAKDRKPGLTDNNWIIKESLNTYSIKEAAGLAKKNREAYQQLKNAGVPVAELRQTQLTIGRGGRSPTWGIMHVQRQTSPVYATKIPTPVLKKIVSQILDAEFKAEKSGFALDLHLRNFGFNKSVDFWYGEPTSKKLPPLLYFDLSPPMKLYKRFTPAVPLSHMLLDIRKMFPENYDAVEEHVFNTLKKRGKSGEAVVKDTKTWLERLSHVK